MNFIYKKYEKYIIDQHATGKYRKLPDFFCTETESYLNFSSNDYLGFSRNSEIIEAAVHAARSYGVGSTGSRLLSGNTNVFSQVEQQIAKDTNKESALIFTTGFQANVSALSTLLDKNILKETPIVFFDKLNHVSLYQALALSEPHVVRYRHCDMQHLSHLLEKYSADRRPKFIISETVFGMDGDIVPLQNLMDLARKFQAFLYLDESHAIGVFGSEGYGFLPNLSCSGVSCVQMGAFSKALGCNGGYIACDHLIKELLLNKAQGFIYSTANSPMVMGAVQAAWQRIKSCQKERKHLKFLGDHLRSLLIEKGFDIGNSVTHIVPIIVKEERRALEITKNLLKHKVIVSCVRPPSVPIGKSCIRIAICSYHNKSDIEYLVHKLASL